MSVNPLPWQSLDWRDFAAQENLPGENINKLIYAIYQKNYVLIPSSTNLWSSWKRYFVKFPCWYWCLWAFNHVPRPPANENCKWFFSVLSHHCAEHVNSSASHRLQWWCFYCNIKRNWYIQIFCGKFWSFKILIPLNTQSMRWNIGSILIFLL